jgi:hypothetical protein
MVASSRYVENIIAMLARAADANRQTPGRQGNVVVIGPDLADEVMITGDLHGHRRNFNLIRRTAALDKHPRRHLILQEICHGGPQYPQNGGCMSHTLVEDVARLKADHPQRVHVILGNHELAELTDYPIQKSRQMLNVMFQMGLECMYGDAADRVRAALLFFLRTCPLAIRLPHGVFVSHSIPEFVDTREFDAGIFQRELEQAELLERDSVFRLVWGRDYRSQNAQAFANLVGAQLLINGHEPCPEGFIVPNPNQIILDCCGERACYLVLPTDRELSQAEAVARIGRLG